MTMRSINPATGELLAEFESWDAETLDDVVTQASYQFIDWAQLTSIADRCHLLNRLGDVLLDDREILAELITMEMGKLYSEALAEIDKCAELCDYYADNAEHILANQPIESEASQSYIAHLPLGSVFGVMPANAPFLQVLHFAIPTLTAGNVVLVKHASSVPQCGLALAEVFRKAGYPDGLFNNLMIDAEQVESVIRHAAVKAVFFAGSESAGRKVAAIAGSELKKIVLELGGSDPFVVLENASIRRAVEGAIKGRFANMGQRCNAAKRIIIDTFIADDFTEKLKVAVEEKFVAGNPMESETTLAPMAKQAWLDKVHQQVTESIELGAKLVTGGYQLDREGFYYAPTILANVSSNMPVCSEEVFGPVAVIIKASEPAHALGLANATRFGLSGSVWTDDLATAETIALGMESGATFINEVVTSDPRLPHGGMKNSGFGRALSEEGMKEISNKKVSWVK